MSDSNELIDFIASMSGEGNLRVEENLGEGFVRLRISEAERRQAQHDIQHVEDIVIEMLRNARDAGAQAIYVVSTKEGQRRTLLFLDNGNGVPEHLHERIFDARVTSKLESMKMDRWGVHGRGMALFSIRQNTEQARVVNSMVDGGSVFEVLIDTEHLPERADQSSWPQAHKVDGVWTCAKGPHNIIRTVCEFALEELHACDVYLGTPTEIAATLFAHASSHLDASRLLFIDDPHDLPIIERLGMSSDAQEFIEIASSLGLTLSERTAHRILAQQMPPLKSVSARLLRQRDPEQMRELDLLQDRRGLKIAKDDLASFSRALERDFLSLAERYYLSLNGEPRIRVTRGKITVSFDISHEE
ncbi:ATP-binding protein [Collinsella sp. zg1085]|uniref:ATP-binding protein n=1 Tax=Collinsella sp. zg1085 TaxID=2844380 RepID=UPI001C0DD961|nr:ATP-binding protein [Collinsella sp. zg1085]QWT16997.1 ATP-binding protein [Collinsella sp. zg1085]